jgi:hypothetical protein
MPTEHVEVVVLVKAAPVLTRHLDETMCVAGVRVDTPVPEWIRLHPVPFRDLARDDRFAKYQQVAVDVRRPRADRRPESWVPDVDSMTPGPRIDSGRAWADRRRLVEGLSEAVMCDLIAANQAGSGPGVPSLAVVRPVAPPTLEITERDDEQLRTWRARAEAAKGRVGLFDDPSEPKPDFEVVPWRFRYGYRCAKDGCGGHHQTIVDWEVVALWRNVRHRPNWQDLMRQKFERELWDGRNSVLFVGNQEQHPISWLVLGVFWPPDTAYQPRLDL